MDESREKNLTLAWCLCWGLLATIWCTAAGRALGPTFDEPFYLRAGLKNWRDLNHRELLTQGTMPLPGEVQTLPLRLAELVADVDPARDWLAWLPTARLGTIPFLWLLLWASYRLGSIYGGTWGGRLAVALVACEPILLGHASLATTDLAFTACLLALLAVFRGRRDDPAWTTRLVVPGAWVTLTILAKASALVFVPVCLALVELERLWSAGWRPHSWRQMLMSMRDVALIGLMGVVLLFLVCPRAWRGLAYQIHQNMNGHGESYLLGAVSPDGYWYYFLAALTIKLGLPVLILLAATLLLRPRMWLNGPICAALGLLALTPSFRLQLGVRYVLPIAVLAMVGASAVFARFWSQQEVGWRKTLAGAFATALMLGSFANAVAVWPNGICYTNELFGGTARGHLALHDSNYDWGQGLPELTEWQRRHPEAPLHVWYYGTDPNAQCPPFHAISFGPSWDGAAIESACGGGYLAVSTSITHGSFVDTPVGRYLNGLQSCGRTTTFLIYDFRESQSHRKDG